MSVQKVALLLDLYRTANDAGRVNFRRRDKNLQTLAELEITPSHMREVVAALRPEDALCEPWPNKHPDYADEMSCKFGTQVRDRDIYVKITAVGLPHGARGCVISFHFAEQPLRYPFKPDTQ